MDSIRIVRIRKTLYTNKSGHVEVVFEPGDIVTAYAGKYKSGWLFLPESRAGESWTWTTDEAFNEFIELITMSSLMHQYYLKEL